MRKFVRFACVFLFGVALLLASHAPLSANSIIGTFNWSGMSIQGERDDYFPSGQAVFSYAGGILEILLTNNTSAPTLAIGEVLTGLTWEFTKDGVYIDSIDALIEPGSRLVGVGTIVIPDDDLSTEWGFKDNLDAGPGIGSFGISAVGDVNFGADSFGPKDRFDETGNPFPPPSGSLNGIDAGIVGPNVDFSSDGFTSQGPVVQGWDGSTAPGEMRFSFVVLENLALGDITNVQPFFGSDGAFLVPEPTTLLLLGTGLICVAGLRRKGFFA